MATPTASDPTDGGPGCFGTPADRLGTLADRLGTLADRFDGCDDRLDNHADRFDGTGDHVGGPADCFGDISDRFGGTSDRRGACAGYSAVRSLTPTAVTEALAGVGAAEAARDTQTKESGESQRATALRQQAETTLRREAAELTEASKLALAEMPQLREVLGLIERGA